MKIRMMILSALFLIVNCVQSKAVTKTQDIDEVLLNIEELSEGLIFISESDYPVNAFSASRAVSSMTSANFLFATRKPPLSFVNQQSFDSFFNPIIATDETNRWELLKVYLEENLVETTVFKVYITGTTYEVYAVGLLAVPNSESFYIVGIKSYGVAT